jgi:energy-coupling factor transporter ATP-binding protein EcfA2
LVILDEPTTGQDGRNVDGILRLMQGLGETAGTATLMITHDVDLAINYATRVLIMDRGRIVLDTPPEDLARSLEGGAISAVEAPELWSILKLLAPEEEKVRRLGDVVKRLAPHSAEHACLSHERRSISIRRTG